MAINVDKTLAALTKLYDKRAALDKQIITAQKTLIAAADDVAKPKKPAAKKPSTAKKYERSVFRHPWFLCPCINNFNFRLFLTYHSRQM